MLEAVFLILGIVLGGAAGWLWATSRVRNTLTSELSRLQAQAAGLESTANELRRQLAQHEQTTETLRAQLDGERQSRTTADTRLQEAEKRFVEQQQILAEAEKKLKESFEALSAKALQTNAEQFLTSARKTLETLMADARGNLGKHQEAIGGLLKPLGESLRTLQEQNRSMEQLRQKAYGSLEEQVKTLATTSQQLQQETGRLVTSLRSPKVRGRWGEIALRRAAELAGMSEHCDFEEQTSVVDDEQRRFRPDMVVHLPGGRTVVVDAKAVLDAYLDAVAATDEAEGQKHLRRHAEQVRSRIRELSSKSYWEKLGTTPEFVVLFLPGESFFSAAVEIDRDLISSAIESRVVLASPTTLIALLRAIAYGWRQEQLAENAERISQLGREVHERMRTLAEHLSKVGVGLGRAVQSYNQAVGSLEARVLPATRKFKELGAAASDDIPLIEPIEHLPRELDATRPDGS